MSNNTACVCDATALHSNWFNSTHFYLHLTINKVKSNKASALRELIRCLKRGFKSKNHPLYRGEEILKKFSVDEAYQCESDQTYIVVFMAKRRCFPKGVKYIAELLKMIDAKYIVAYGKSEESTKWSIFLPYPMT